jgi:hypothetical protein
LEIAHAFNFLVIKFNIANNFCSHSLIYSMKI